MPPRNESNPYGWDAAKFQRVNSVQLPTKIKCNVCKKNMMSQKFSNKALLDYRINIDRSGLNRAATPRCRGCTGTQAVELTCSQCDTTKALASFSLNQRKNPDHAKCWDCQQEIDDQVPNVADQLAEMEIKQELEQGRGSLFSTTASMSGYSNSSSKIGSSRNGSDEQDGDGVWVPHEPTVGRKKQGLPIQQTRVSGDDSVSVSSASSTTTDRTENSAWRHFTANREPRSPQQIVASEASSASSRPSRGGSQGFARITGQWRNLSAEQRAVVTHEREQRRGVETQQTLNEESDDGSDSDFEL